MDIARRRGGGPVLEITKQDFFQEAKTLIAQHYEKINENKVQGTSINVFRNKHQKPKTSKYIPLEIKKKETLDVIQELQTVQKNIRFPKDVSKSEHFEEPPQRSSFKEPHIFNVKEKFKESMDLLAKEQVKLGKIVTNIESVSKKMEKEKQQYHKKKSRVLDSYAFSITNIGFPLRPTVSPMRFLKESGTKHVCEGIVESQPLSPAVILGSRFPSTGIISLLRRKVKKLLNLSATARFSSIINI
ncbi:IQ domain-containing protein M-like [Pteropus medius]|uniref:IQ domain-containing protein M-like n=1 Tax=Pteropus vampyrus TaxID=132908 RepID=UPI00196A2E20|nr:IQ domain-containing protein M-like [Pteropus giganteus]